jgi:hypothetical protein
MKLGTLDALGFYYYSFPLISTTDLGLICDLLISYGYESAPYYEFIHGKTDPNKTIYNILGSTEDYNMFIVAFTKEPSTELITELSLRFS